MMDPLNRDIAIRLEEVAGVLSDQHADQFDHLPGSLPPVTVLASVRGIGIALARRLHEELGISTLEELATAADDGRLERIGGLGAKRVAGIQGSLLFLLGRRRRTA
jgi:DNA polymerase/3'-5' exonuclease PolX